MKQITDIKELRSIQMGIMDCIHDFCVKSHIMYSLGGGTLIGAFRHKGYIPWDDDIDVYLMRTDYERLINEFYDPTGRYSLIGPHTGKSYYYTFSKMIDTTTVLYEDDIKGYEIGVYVDVFPLDYVTDNLWLRKQVFWWKHMLYKIRSCKILPEQHLQSRAAHLVYRNLPIPLSVINWLIEHFIHRRRLSNTICEMCETDRPLKGCFSVEAFAETINVPFENRTYKSMVGYDEYLSNTYGDYMALPPEDQRMQHKFKAYYK